MIRTLLWDFGDTLVDQTWMLSLCDIALETQGLGFQRAEALLIDNMREDVDRWIAAGGAGYWFRGEQAFASNPIRA